MYETFFGLKRRPFLAVPDTESYFSTDQMEKSSRSIERTVRRGEGIALLIGTSGTGKTLLLRLLRETFKTDYTVLLISNGHLTTSRSFFQQLLYDLRLPFSGGDETEFRLQLLDYARQERRKGGIVVLIDEAQFLSLNVLEEIRLLTNCDDGSTPFFRIVLAGTVELEEILTSPQLDAFNQRIVVRAYLEPFSGEETRNYIAWQTFSSFGKSDVSNPALGLVEFIENSASSEGRRIDSPHIKVPKPIFTENAKRQIFQLTEGLPRLINQLCDISLQLAAERVVRQVDEVLIHSAWARLQQTTDDASTGSVAVAFPAPTLADIDEIIARKKATFQLKEFDSAVEFGTLDDNETETVNESVSEPEPVTTIRFCSPNEYKPPYPEDDEHSEFEPSVLEEEPLENFVAEIEPEPEFYEELDTEMIFSPTDLVSIRQLPLNEELTEAIEVVAEAVVESETEEIVAEIQSETISGLETVASVAEMVEESIEEFVEEIPMTRRPRLFPPRRHRRTDEKLAQKYRRRRIVQKSSQLVDSIFRSLIQKASFSWTFRRFDFTEGWIGNVSFHPLFVPARLATLFRPDIKSKLEPVTVESESIIKTENTENDVIENESTIEEIANEINRENDSEESDMDKETVEKYAEEILKSHLPFVRKEPNYAYQTTDSVTDFIPKTDGKVSYPDPITGNTIQLNWLTSEHNSEAGFGTPYREFLSRENQTKETVCIAKSVTKAEQAAAFAEFDLNRVVRVALDAFDDLSRRYVSVQNHKTSIDESFDEIVVVEPMPGSTPPSSRSLPISLPSSNEDSLSQQITEAIQRITEAVKKIEQAAQQSEDAGQQIQRAAGFVETEVKTALPTYLEFFHELAEFQQTISAELNSALPKHSERPVKFLPFSIRASFSTPIATPLASENGDEKSIDFQKLFQ